MAVLLFATAAPGPARAVDLAIDASPRTLRIEAGKTLPFALSVPAGARLRIVVRELTMEPDSVAGVAVRLRNANDRPAGFEWLHCTPSKRAGGCQAEFSTATAGQYAIDVDAPFSASARFTLAVEAIRVP